MISRRTCTDREPSRVLRRREPLLMMPFLRRLPEYAAYQDKVGIDTMRRVLTAYSWSNPALGYCQVRHLSRRMRLSIASLLTSVVSTIGDEPHHGVFPHLHVGGAMLLVLDRLMRPSPPRLLQSLDVRHRPGSTCLRAPSPTMPSFDPRSLRRGGRAALRCELAVVPLPLHLFAPHGFRFPVSPAGQ